ncbi:hypothetical protein OG979_19155 [Actinomadura citrea]|uniref:hypothetical protein n=1 Tax=Actinomadura citrea TaxID=46158 RepID=UPI002E2BCC0D|nr:hypothetical protein [Actinomadura citrea]
MLVVAHLVAEGYWEAGGGKTRGVLLSHEVRLRLGHRQGGPPWSWPAEAGELYGSLSGGCCLGATLLLLPELRDSLDQGCKLHDEVEQDSAEARAVTASSLDLREGKGSGNCAEVRSVRSGRWLVYVGFASGSIVEVGGFDESSIAGDGRGDVEDVGSCGGQVGSDGRVLNMAHLPAGCGSGSGGLLISRGSFLV